MVGEGRSAVTLPGGTVTMLFSDIEGSTQLLDRIGARHYADVLVAQRGIVREAIAAHDGYEAGTEGDSFFVVFATARDAVLAAAAIQRGLADATWPDGARVRVRMGIHSGEVRIVDDDYVGMEVHRAARIGAAAHGGQVLVGEATTALVAGQSLDVSFADLGAHRLKDLSRSLRLFQLTGDGLEATFPPPRTLDTQRTNLPAVATPLIGRERELADIRAMLGTPAVRLLTLTGSGGAGKTRLALGAAAEASDLFPGGTYVTFLAGVPRPELVPPAVAAALGVRDEPSRPLHDAVLDALRGPPVLLVLDNLEHLLDAAPFAAELLAGAQDLKLLATSRAPLRVAGERELGVDGLAPERAAELFVERGRAVQADFAPDEPVMSEIDRICARLDGQPLAIELAAARVRVLPPAAILTRLHHGLDVLAAGRRDLPERQRTLRATIAWSYDLLSPAEQALLCRLAVFAGGFPLDLAAAVVAPGTDVMEGVASLVEQSLLRPVAAVASEPRFLMLETIRAFALDQLAERDELDALRGRHAEAVVELVERAAQDLHRGHEIEWLDRLDAELDNIRAAADRIGETGRTDLDLRLAASIRNYGHLRGRWTETLRWVERALAHGPGDAPELYGRVLAAGAVLAQWDGRAERADDLSLQLLELADAHGDRAGRAHALMGLALGAVTRRMDMRQATAYLEEAADLFREVGEMRALGTVLNNLGDAAMNAGDFEAALSWLEQSAQLGESEGLLDRVVMARGNLASARTALGDAAGARAELMVAWREGRRLGYPDPLLYGAATLAAITLLEGDPQGAARLVGTVEAAFETAQREIEAFEADRHRELVATLRERLGDQRFEALREEGRAVSLDALIDRVLASRVPQRA